VKSDAGPAQLLHVFSTFVPAGPEMRTVRLINALGDSYRHSILAIDGRNEARSELSRTADWRILPSLPRRGTLATVRALAALFRRENPDLVLSYNWGAFDGVLASLSLGRGRRHLHHEDGFNADEARQFKARRLWARRLVLPRVARVIVPSRVLEGIACERWKLGRDHVQLIPNGIDPASFGARDGNPELRRRLGIAVEVPVVGFVGHLRPVKNPLRLLRAFAGIRTAPLPELVILGEGQERASIERARSELGLEERVHLVGHQADTSPWYRLMDLFALSSDSEQMPVALLEAMASSLPVVSTEVGDVAHMLGDEQREFVVAGGGDDLEPLLTRALERLLANCDLRDRLGRANRARVEEHYCFEAMLASYRRLYEATLENRS